MARGRSARFNDSIMSVVTNLSDDIFFAIFLKLSVKSIIQCRCVCKSWRQSLYDPHFIKLHSSSTDQHHQSHNKLLLRSSSNSFYSVDLETGHGNAVQRNFPLKSLFFKEILGSCNGLLCLAIKQSSLYKTYLEVVLWNPSTGDYKKLPSVEPPVDNDQTVGFGYDSSLDDYKMVRIITRCSEYRVDMYSLKANSWKIIGDLPAHYNIFRSDFKHGLCLNGSIYWVRWENITCFDLKNEKFREVLWGRYMEPQGYVGLWVMGGYLGFYHKGPRGELVKWGLKEDDDNKEEWIKLMTINPSNYHANITVEFTYNYKPLKPVCLMENGKVLLCVEEIFPKKTSKTKFLVYDPKRSRIVFEVFPIQGISDNYGKCVTYEESLVSPNFA